MRAGAWLAAAACFAACGGDDDDDEHASLEAGIDAAVHADDAAVADASADAAPVGPTPTPLPLAAEDVRELGAPGGIEVMSALLDDGAALHLVYERFDVAFGEGHLEERVGADPLALSPPAPFGGDATYVASPSAASATALYRLEAGALDGRATLLRTALGARGWGDDEEVDTASVFTLLMWPRVLELDDGRFALAFRDGSSRPRLAFSDDGASFDDADLVGPPGAMANVGAFADGTLVYTYQTEDGGMTSWVVLSSDGRAWSDPVAVTDASPNVHDTSSVRREDGDLDLYYIYSTALEPGFSLYRRALASDGALGPEERFTDATVGEPSKPAVTRLRDGRLFVRWAAITVRDGTGLPVEQVLQGAVVVGDAAR